GTIRGMRRRWQDRSTSSRAGWPARGGGRGRVEPPARRDRASTDAPVRGSENYFGVQVDFGRFGATSGLEPVPLLPEERARRRRHEGGAGAGVLARAWPGVPEPHGRSRRMNTVHFTMGPDKETQDTRVARGDKIAAQAPTSKLVQQHSDFAAAAAEMD